MNDVFEVERVRNKSTEKKSGIQLAGSQILLDPRFFVMDLFLAGSQIFFCGFISHSLNPQNIMHAACNNIKLTTLINKQINQQTNKQTNKQTHSCTCMIYSLQKEFRLLQPYFGYLSCIPLCVWHVKFKECLQFERGKLRSFPLLLN